MAGDGAGTAPGERRPALEDVTVVIPTLGRPILRDCLGSIAAGSAWPGRIVVVDQGLREEIAALLREATGWGIPCDYVPSRERGRARGVNRGVERARTRFVAITDDDCRVEPSWLERLVAALRAHPEAVVTGRVEGSGEGVELVVTSREPAVYTRPGWRFDRLSGGNMGLARALFDAVGPLDEDPRLAFAEDGEWAYRALRAGVPIRYEPEAGVTHHGWRSPEERTGQYRNYARSHGAFYGKYLRRGDLWIALRAALHQFRAMQRWLRATLSGEQEVARIARAYATGLLPGILSMLRRHAEPP
jgi:GT2 family glycosyltransferase